MSARVCESDTKRGDAYVALTYECDSLDDRAWVARYPSLTVVQAGLRLPSGAVVPPNGPDHVWVTGQDPCADLQEMRLGRIRAEMQATSMVASLAGTASVRRRAVSMSRTQAQKHGAHVVFTMEAKVGQSGDVSVTMAVLPGQEDGMLSDCAALARMSDRSREAVMVVRAVAPDARDTVEHLLCLTSGEA